MDVDDAIRQRKTTKVLAKQGALPCPSQPDGIREGVIAELLALAGMAPFHRACDTSHRGETDATNRQSCKSGMTGIEPWRFHVLLAKECRELCPKLTPEEAGNIPFMLSSAEAAILATWLPNPPSAEFVPTETHGFEPTLGNMEHIAAASAAIQNLLLAATSRGISNYWSSGGILRWEAMKMLGIPESEILLGGVFLFPSDTGSAEVVGSKLREHRNAAPNWSQHLKVE